MQLKLKECPVCKYEGHEKFIETKDFMISQESFTIVKCTRCAFIYTNPRPFDYELGKYYASENYDSHKTKGVSLKDFLYQIVRNISAQKKLNYLNSITSGKRLLDVGSGAGYFLNLCEKNKWKAEGIEPNLNSFPNLNQGIKIHSGFKTVSENEFDIITMWHSLEHIPDLEKTLLAITKSLKKDGKLIIAVPNIASKDFDIYKEYWAALDVPRHLYHFTQKSIDLLLSNYDLKVSRVMPMIFDSYYVSLLSEKYKTGKNNYFKAFKNGKLSNQWAKKNNNNYSSLMYTVIKK